jgi:2-dehydro-3-deoxyphosphogluconate aldolase / (4S)-4-hydroxy-2-oxoglutarate aldolase
MGFTKEQISRQIETTGIVPLFTHDQLEDAKHVIDAAYRGGIRAFEFTNRKSNSFEVFSQLIKYVAKYPDLMLGIGTVMDASTTEKFLNAGAHFIISPIMKVEMGEVCQRHNIHWMPGCATLTEIVVARDHGAELIKVFPGSVLGPAFVSSIMPVVPNLKLMITGGVELSEENLRAWFKAGAMCVGLGSNLFTKDILERKDWLALETRIREAVDLIKRIRQ